MGVGWFENVFSFVLKVRVGVGWFCVREGRKELKERKKGGVFLLSFVF